MSLVVCTIEGEGAGLDDFLLLFVQSRWEKKSSARGEIPLWSVSWEMKHETEMFLVYNSILPGTVAGSWKNNEGLSALDSITDAIWNGGVIGKPSF